MNVGRLLRIVAAIALLIGGLVHLDLYFGGYRSAGDANFGRSILFTAIAYGVVAVAVAVRTEWFIRAAGILLPAATIGAFAYVHAGNEMFGFSAEGFEPSPQAQLALIVEIAAIVLLAVTFVPSIAAADTPFGMPVLGAATAIAAVALIAFGAYWANDQETTEAASGPSSVTIADFQFVEPTLDVPVGSTITWTNTDSIAHTVTASDQSFGSDTLDGGATFEFTFESAGQFAYFCAIHPSMQGTVVVTG